MCKTLFGYKSNFQKIICSFICKYMHIILHVETNDLSSDIPVKIIGNTVIDVAKFLTDKRLVYQAFYLERITQNQMKKDLYSIIYYQKCAKKKYIFWSTIPKNSSHILIGGVNFNLTSPPSPSSFHLWFQNCILYIYRLDHDSNRSGIFLYAREDIPSNLTEIENPSRAELV